jgi:outer membrane lipoprotein-sorting protein
MAVLRSFFLAIAIFSAPAAVSVATAQTALFGSGALIDLKGSDKASALDGASKALQSQTRVKGGFVQIGPDGSVAKGKFYLSRPGKIRFEYSPPTALLVVADGSTVAIQDNRLKTFNRAPLRSTPMYFFLKPNIDLGKDAKVVRVAKQSGTLAIAVKDKSGQSDGVLTLLFDPVSYELRQWLIEDGAGGVTRVALNNVERVAQFEPSLFVLQPKKVPIRR